MTRARDYFYKKFGHLIDANGCADYDQWPNDDWYGVSDTEDINVWSDDDGHCHCQSYAVYDGEIDTTEPIELIFTTAEYPS
jgi:hypothetical protein